MVEIKEYNENDYNLWNNFIKESANGTLFHEQKFISYHKNKFNDNSLLFLNKGKLIAVFPASVVAKNNKKVLKSHPGTSYGGLVVNKNIKLKLVFELIESLENYCKKNRIDAIEFRHSPNIFRKLPLDQLDFALIHKGYQKIDNELSTCYELNHYRGLSLNDSINKFDNDGRSKAKKNIRKGIKYGLTFRELRENEVSIYYLILSRNLKKHNAKPVHSLDDIKYLMKLYPDRVKLYGVFYEENLAAGYLIFNINQIGNHIFYGSLNYEYQHLRPTSYGLFMLIKTFADNGDKYLNMGISTEDGGKIINWDLFAFKESFNGTGTLRYYWQKRL